MNRTVPILAVVVTVAMSGCVGSLPGLGGNNGGQAADPVEHVPADVDVVVSVDAAVAEDENTRTLLNTLLEESDAAPGDPQNVDELGEEFQQQFNDNLSVNLSLSEINGLAAFARTPEDPTAEVEAGQQYGGVVLSVDWDREDVLENIRAEASVSETTYEGVTVYEIVNESADSTTYGAQYEDGLWVFSGNRTAVEDVIDVAQGNADSFGGDLRETFDQTREDAYVRYATTVSDEQRQTIRQLAALYGRDAPIDVTQFGDVTAYAGAYYTEGENIGVSTYLTATNESSADRLNETLGALITLGQSSVEPDSPAEAQLEALSAELDGRTVSIVYEIPVETLQEFVREQSDTASGALSQRPATAPVTG